VPHVGGTSWPQTTSVPPRCAPPTGDGDSAAARPEQERRAGRSLRQSRP
jgi:hypothetical protein